MREIERVMVCVDFSDYSKDTVEFALSVANARNTNLMLLNVINNRDIEAIQSVGSYLSDSPDVNKYVERVQNKRLQKMEKMIDENFALDKLRMKTQVRVGVPYIVILEAAKEEGVDLLVLANKGRGNQEGTLHGSNGEKIFRHSPVPVLSYRSIESFNKIKENR